MSKAGSQSKPNYALGVTPPPYSGWKVGLGLKPGTFRLSPAIRAITHCCVPCADGFPLV